MGNSTGVVGDAAVTLKTHLGISITTSRAEKQGRSAILKESFGHFRGESSVIGDG
jgi:hypothetical protein